MAVPGEQTNRPMRLALWVMTGRLLTLLIAVAASLALLGSAQAAQAPVEGYSSYQTATGQATGSSEASVSPHASCQPSMSLASRSPGPA
jgi:hypothetical protein